MLSASDAESVSSIEKVILKLLLAAISSSYWS